MRKIILIITLFSIVSIKAQQEPKILYPEPYPGWIIIPAKIKYPEPAILAGVDNTYNVHLTIDSLGNQTSLIIVNMGKYKTFDSLFTIEIANAFNAINWDAGSIDDIPATMEITMLILFTQSTGIRMQSKPVLSTISVDSDSKIKIDSIKVSY